MYTLEFKLQGLPNTSNQSLRGNWKTNLGFAKTWKRKVWAAVWPLRPPEPLKKARLTLTRHSSARPDFDNLAASFKSCIDGLVEAGVLEDDSFKQIGIPTYLWESAKKSEGHVSIKVEELESNLEFAIK